MDKPQTLIQPQDTPVSLSLKSEDMSVKEVVLQIPSPVSMTSVGQTSENVRKRKKSVLKDENAPKAPQTGYLRFMNKHRETIRHEKPEMAFPEVTKILGTMWSELPQQQKQFYLDEAEKDKVRYLDELKKYQQTEAYKSFHAQQLEAAKRIKMIQNLGAQSNSLFCHPCGKHFSSIHNKNEHVSGRKHRRMIQKAMPRGQHVTTEPINVITVRSDSDEKQVKQLPPVKKVATTDTTVLENSLNIPVFSKEFLDYNKSRESELRKLKKATNDCEEQNAILNKQNDNLKSAIGKFQEEEKRCKDNMKNLEPFLKNLRSVLAQSFSNLPGTDRAPTEDTVGEFLVGLLSENNMADNDTVGMIKQIIATLDYPNCLNNVE